MSTCNCTNDFDIRARCDIRKKKFTFCYAKYDTLYWHLENDYDTYKLLEKNPNNYKKIIYNYCKQYLKTDNEIKKIIEMYEEQEIKEPEE